MKNRVASWLWPRRLAHSTMRGAPNAVREAFRAALRELAQIPINFARCHPGIRRRRISGTRSAESSGAGGSGSRPCALRAPAGMTGKERQEMPRLDLIGTCSRLCGGLINLFRPKAFVVTMVRSYPGGADEATGIHHGRWRCGGGFSSCGAGAATGALGWLPKQRLTRHLSLQCRLFSRRPGEGWLRRGPQCPHRGTVGSRRLRRIACPCR
jgi:hypothetical protein